MLRIRNIGPGLRYRVAIHIFIHVLILIFRLVFRLVFRLIFRIQFLVLQFFILIVRLLRIIVNTDDLSLPRGNLYKRLEYSKKQRTKNTGAPV